MGPFRVSPGPLPPLYRRGTALVITSLEITRLRGIREGKLEDLTPLVVLVGPNGCGKSTVLDALLIGASPNVGDGIRQAVLRHRGVREGASWLVWKAEERGSAEIVLRAAPDNARRCTILVPEKSCVECKVAPSSATSRGSEHVQVLLADSGRKTRTGGTVPLPGVPNVRIVECAEEPLLTPLDALLTQCIKSGKKHELTGYLTELAPSIRDILILTEAAGAPIVHIEYSDRSVPAALAGDGYHALVRVLLELATCAEGLVLFEEPEIHQHPAAIRQTVRAIVAAVRRDIQVVLTTHSLELIDAILAETSDDDLAKLSVYRLHLVNGLLTSRRLSGSDVAFSRMEIENDLR